MAHVHVLTNIQILQHVIKISQCFSVPLYKLRVVNRVQIQPLLECYVNNHICVFHIHY